MYSFSVSKDRGIKVNEIYLVLFYPCFDVLLTAIEAVEMRVQFILLSRSTALKKKKNQV